jgi:hypothetical protein
MWANFEFWLKVHNNYQNFKWRLTCFSARILTATNKKFAEYLFEQKIFETIAVEKILTLHDLAASTEVFEIITQEGSSEYIS